MNTTGLVKTTGHSSAVLEEYRRLVENDLRRVEQNQDTAARLRPTRGHAHSEAAAAEQVRDVLISLRQVLNDYYPARQMVF
ncbi:hypothetical protein ACFRAO_23625 [Streptomyces sp. NPDC056656]|uniref:hypothetical protein n=1 Tax=Streptomyces sp. NPDC056656 TaxID=3345895 RepID=UPI003695F2DD